MGNCCGGSTEPSCALGQNELASIAHIAKEVVNAPKSYIPYTAPYVGKCTIAKTGCPFNQLTQKILKDNTPIDKLQADGVPPIQVPPGCSIPQDPFSRVAAATVSDVNRQVAHLLLTAAIHSVKGVTVKDQKEADRQKERCAQNALLRYSQQAVAKEIDLILKSSQQDIMQYSTSPRRMGASASSSPLGNNTQGGGPSLGVAGSMKGNPPMNNNNNNGNNNYNATHYPPTSSSSSSQQQQQQQQNYQNNNNANAGDRPNLDANNFASNPNYPNQNSDLQQQEQQQQNPNSNNEYYQTFQRSMSEYNETQQQLHQQDEVASPTNEAWHRYPLPEENGPWVPINEAFYYSEACGLYYFPAAGHFFDPASQYWHNPETDEWITEEEHEMLLERMAADGLY